jgi:hypothetical protein
MVSLQLSGSASFSQTDSFFVRSSTKGGNLHRNERGRLGFGQQELRRRTLENFDFKPPH